MTEWLPLIGGVMLGAFAVGLILAYVLDWFFDEDELGR